MGLRRPDPPDAPYDTRDVREFLTNGGLYHRRISDTFLIAYNFRFHIDAHNRIGAQGVVHPAIQRRDDHHTDKSVVLSWANVIISPVDPDADQAFRFYIRVHHMDRLPPRRCGFRQTADQV